MHGFSINVSNELAGFRRIVPCGIDETDRDVVTLQQLLEDAAAGVEVDSVKQQVLHVFSEYFRVEYEHAGLDALDSR